MSNTSKTPKNARAKIVSGSNDRMKQTATVDRDYGAPDVKITTDLRGRDRRTTLRLLGFGPSGCKVNLQLNGHEARTLYRVLDKHYGVSQRAKASAEQLQDTIELGQIRLMDERRHHEGTKLQLGDLACRTMRMMLVEVPSLIEEAYDAGAKSMVEPMKAAVTLAHSAGVVEGAKAAQQLELFSRFIG